MSITERTDLALATIMARRGVGSSEIGKKLGFEAPDGPAWAGKDALKLLGTGPGAWLALAEQGEPFFSSRLQEVLAGLASVSDQSSGYVVFRLSGSGARTLLQRGAAIDFHPSVFGAHSVATTVIAHIGVIIWLVDDAPTYDLAVFRSFAGSLRQWIEHSAAAL